MDIYHIQDDVEPSHLFTIRDRYTEQVFQGIMPDTGAARFSTGGLSQYLALRQVDNTATDIDKSQMGMAKVGFGPGKEILSIGSTIVRTVIGPITFHIIEQPTPFLLCLDDMRQHGLIVDVLADELVQGDKRFPLTLKWGHLWFHLQGPEAAAVNLTESELKQLHRRFNHPAVDRLHKVLTEAGHEDVDRKLLETITKFCHHCQTHAPAPQRFKFTLKDDREFNYEIFVDVFYLDGQPVLHVVDSATSFHGARFLKTITAKETWEALRTLWIDTYLGPPDVIVHDAGTNFAAAEFRNDAKIMGIHCKQVPVEAHWGIGKVERAHYLLRRAYDILTLEIGNFTSKEAILQMAVKGLNDTVGPNGLVPTLLVFGAYPRMTHESPPSTTTIKRAAAYDKAMRELRKATAKRQVNDALNARNGPSMTDVLSLPLQSEVLVHRETGKWDGPFKVLSIADPNIVVGTSNGPITFRKTHVRRYNRAPDTAGDEADSIKVNQHNPPPPVVDTPMDRPRRGRPPGSKNRTKVVNADDDDDEYLPGTAYHTAWISRKEEADLELALQLRAEGKILTPGAVFEESDRTEIDALIAQGVVKFVQRKDFNNQDIQIFKSRIVHEIKGKTTNKPYEKSRLVAQGYGDAGKDWILTQSPTIQRVSQRLVVVMAACMLTGTDATLNLRDITQAYIQSTTDLQRTILLQLPVEMRDKYPAGTMMWCVKPLYGIAESGVHWFVTYQNHHKDKLDMAQSTFDPCLLITKGDKHKFGLLGMQTDDTLFLGQPAFVAAEQKEIEISGFKTKPVQTLSPETPLEFNGSTIRQHGKMDGQGFLTMCQKGQGAKINIIDKTDPNRAQRYLEQRARGAYISSICQPEAAFDLSVAAQAQQPTDEDFDKLNKRLEWQMHNLDRGLRMVPIDLTTAKLMIFTDGSFANNKDLSSQIGFLMMLVNEDRSDSQFEITGNLIHYTSIKCKRVTRSVLASEVYGMMAGFDTGISTADTIRMITSRLGLPAIPVVICTDSRSLYECLSKLGTTDEKRLMIDVMALRESYEKREIEEFRWIDGKDNPADAMTKATPNNALERFINTNQLMIRVEGYVDRPTKSPAISA